MRDYSPTSDGSDWNPRGYLAFADERARPFRELLARVNLADPRRVVDLGCGPGTLTVELADRWPQAQVTGVDSSPAMIERATELAGPRLRFVLGDLRGWTPPAGGTDLIVSNAALQWVPGHRDLLPRLVAGLRPGGVLALQVPGNFAEPSHRLLREIAGRPPYREATAGVEQPAAHDAATYLADLTALGCTVDAWETTYLHVLTGPDPVFAWVAGTGARPVLQALGGLREQFEQEYRAALREAYPPAPHGTVLPFRRVFAVARTPAP